MSEKEIQARKEIETAIAAARNASPEDEVAGLGPSSAPFYHEVRPSNQPKQYKNNSPEKAEDRLLLTYFAIKGLGEVPRLMLAEVGAEYDTFSIIGGEDQANAINWRSRSPNGLLPMLSGATIPRSGPISQSGAVIRFLARHFGLNGTTELEACRADTLYETAKDMNEKKDLISSKDAEQDMEAPKMPFALALRVEKMLETMPNPKEEDAVLNYGQIQLYSALESCEGRRKGCVEENLGTTLDSFRINVQQRKGIAEFLKSKVCYPHTHGELGNAEGGYNYVSGPLKRGDIMSST